MMHMNEDEEDLIVPFLSNAKDVVSFYSTEKERRIRITPPAQ